MSGSVKQTQVEILEHGLEIAFNTFVEKFNHIFLGQALQRQRWITNRNLFVEYYTVLKALLPFLLLVFNCYRYFWICIVPLYFTLETINYNCLHIFQAKKFPNRKSLTRNILLGLFNYIEIILNFAFLYAAFNCIKSSTSFGNERALNFLDYIYFSVVTGTTVGYGDFIAVGNIGHILVISQIFTFVLFFTIFITYNLSLFINNANTNE